jgi:hypothetical protein
MVVWESEDEGEVEVCRVGEEGGDVTGESRYGCCVVVFCAFVRTRVLRLGDGESKIATYLHDVVYNLQTTIPAVNCTKDPEKSVQVTSQICPHTKADHDVVEDVCRQVNNANRRPVSG